MIPRRITGYTITAVRISRIPTGITKAVPRLHQATIMTGIQAVRGIRTVPGIRTIPGIRAAQAGIPTGDITR